MLTVLLKEREARGSTGQCESRGVQSWVCKAKCAERGLRARGAERGAQREMRGCRAGDMRGGAGTAAMLLMTTKP